MSKKFSVGFATVVLGAMLLPAVWAQDAAQAGGPPPPPDGPGMHARGGPWNPDQQVRRLTRALNLTSDQQQQVRQVLEQRDAQLGKMDASALTGPQRHEQMKSIREDADTKVRAVLTDEQKQKFDAMRAQQMERWQGKRGGPPPPAEGAEPPMQQ